MSLTTEDRNPATNNLDQVSTLELVRIMNKEDAGISSAVAKCADVIADAIDLIANQLQDSGRLIYVGAGTSGRLGVLDASECPPTFNTDPEQVVGIIAGGDTALRQAIEGAEDSKRQGADSLRAIKLTSRDVVAGIAASGGTPYVLGALEFAVDEGARTIAISCNAGSAIGALADIDIAAVVGPEVITGSTRLKAGTATKLVLNMLTTGAMVRLGKTYGNLMVDLRASNKKLQRRAIHIVSTVTEIPELAARELLEECGGEVKTAIVCHSLQVTPEQARAALAASGGRVRLALDNMS